MSAFFGHCYHHLSHITPSASARGPPRLHFYTLILILILTLHPSPPSACSHSPPPPLPSSPDPQSKINTHGPRTFSKPLPPPLNRHHKPSTLHSTLLCSPALYLISQNGGGGMIPLNLRRIASRGHVRWSRLPVYCKCAFKCAF